MTMEACLYIPWFLYFLSLSFVCNALIVPEQGINLWSRKLKYITLDLKSQLPNMMRHWTLFWGQCFTMVQSNVPQTSPVADNKLLHKWTNRVNGGKQVICCEAHRSSQNCIFRKCHESWERAHGSHNAETNISVSLLVWGFWCDSKTVHRLRPPPLTGVAIRINKYY